ncbi:unnamed protein product [Cochlearia groenlandica]
MSKKAKGDRFFSDPIVECNVTMALKNPTGDWLVEPAGYVSNHMWTMVPIVEGDESRGRFIDLKTGSVWKKIKGSFCCRRLKVENPFSGTMGDTVEM